MARHLHVIEWGTNQRIQGPYTSVKFLEVKWCGASQDILSKVKDKLLYLVLIKSTKPSEALDFRGNIFFTLGVLLWPIYRGTGVNQF